MLDKLHGRQARPATAYWNVTKTIVQTALFWTFFLVVLPWIVYRLEAALGLAAWRFSSPLARALGIVLFALGGALGLTSGTMMAIIGRGTPLPMDCAREIVVAGPYRYVRNPMAVAGISQGAAVGVFLGSPAVVIYALSGAPVWNYLVRPWEEQDLEQRFGDSYRRYRQEVWCWWPRLRPFHFSSNVAGTSNGDSPNAEREPA